MDVQFLTEADWILSRCGQPLAPTGQRGVNPVYKTKYFFVQSIIPPAGQPGSTQTFTKVITGDTNWELRSISANWLTGQLLYLQIQAPDGTFLSNVLMDDLIFAGFGSNRWVATEPIECAPGSKFIFAFDTNFPAASSSQNMTIVLEGAYKYYVKSQVPHFETQQWAESMPRYLGNPNQNILAPCWTQGYGPGTPDGYVDEVYTYGSGEQIISGTFFPGITIPLAGPLVSTATIQIQRTSDFVCRRFFFWVVADASVSAGEILARIRLSSGYAVSNDYFDVFRYIGGSMLAHDLNIKSGDSIVFDLSLVDSSGTGNMYFEAFADGCRRFPMSSVEAKADLEIPQEPELSREVIIPAGGGPVRTLPPGLRGSR